MGSYTITVREFMARGYNARIRRGECKVYSVEPPPGEDAGEFEKEAWNYLIECGADKIEIDYIEGAPKSPDYFLAHAGIGILGMGNENELLVVSLVSVA
jgi:hypothetical protein